MANENGSPKESKQSALKTVVKEVDAGDLLLIVGVLLVACFIVLCSPKYVLLWLGFVCIYSGWKVVFSQPQPQAPTAPQPKRIGAAPL